MTHMSAKRFFGRAFIVVMILTTQLIVACGGGSGGGSDGSGGSGAPIPLPPFEVQVAINNVETPDCSNFTVFFNVSADNSLIRENLEDGVSLALNGALVDDFDYSLRPEPLDDPVSIVFVMDYSRSMPPDAIQAMESAVIAFLNDLKSGDYALIIKFASDTRPSNGLVEVGTNLGALIDFVNSDVVPTKGDTDIYGAADEAVDSLIMKALTERRAVIFLTDGEQTAPPTLTLDYVILKARDAGIPFFTIGLMVDAFDETDIKRMALETGGFFFRTEVNQLADKYEEIRDALFLSNHIIDFQTSETVSKIEVSVTYDGKIGSDQVLIECP